MQVLHISFVGKAGICVDQGVFVEEFLADIEAFVTAIQGFADGL
jgi:hypothetical protein